MARDGSGTANRVVSDYTFNTVIDEAGVNAELDDVYSELTNSIAADGQTNPTGNLPMATYRHTGVGNAAARDDYAAAGQVQDNAFIWCGTASGTKNALTLTPSPAITAYTAGQRFVFIAGATASDSTVTVAISGLAAQAVQVNGAPLSSSVTIEAGKLYQIDYDGTQFQATRLSNLNVAGPASSTDNGLPRFDGTTGQLIQGSGITVDDSDNLAGVGTITPDAFSDGTNTIAATVLTQTSKASAFYNHVSATVQSSYNVSSVDDDGTGDIGWNLTSALTSGADIRLTFGVGDTDTGTAVQQQDQTEAGALTASAFDTEVYAVNASTNRVNVDNSRVFMSVHGVLS